MVKINGEALEKDGQVLAEFLANSKYNGKRIAVEINGEIVPKSHYSETILRNGDMVEIVSFVGGG